jgi:uncharacterized protein (TIGR02453 family)
MAFRGWPAEALEFYEGLAADNSRAYWQDHKAQYERDVRAPMAELLAELEPEFGPGRIYRPYRDVRFSRDKTLYKDHIAATLERGGYIQLSARGLAAGTGMYMMDSEQLARYRRAAADDMSGERLRAVIAQVASHDIEVGGHEQLRTAPRGYPRDHPRVDLLRYKGLVSWKQWPVGPWLGTAETRDRVAEFFRASQPLSDWLATYVTS